MNGKRKEEEEDGKENKLAGFSLCLSHILIFSLILSFSPDALLISIRKSMGQRVVDVPVFFVRACV